MRSKKISISPGMLLALVVVFMIASVSASTAASSLINGKKIKKGSIPYSALSSDAKKKLKGNAGAQGPQGPQGAAGSGVTKYWAMVSSSGSIIRSSGGISATYGDNGGGNPQYRVTFPADVSQCGYFGSTSDPDQFSQAQQVAPTDVGVGRSTLGNNTLAVTVTYGYDNFFFNDSFFIAAVC